LSIRNSFNLQLELSGYLLEDQYVPVEGAEPLKIPYRLPVGWECIEVFPSPNFDMWKPELAPLWAENDLLSAALVNQTQGSDLNSIEPRVTARRKYAALLADFKRLLDSEPEREEQLHVFLKANPELLHPTKIQMWSKLPFGAKESDFVFRDAVNDYVLVELENSTHFLFNKNGHANAKLNEAIGQIMDWKRYLEDNLQTVQRELGLDGITSNPDGLVVIGRSSSLSPENRRKLQAMMSNSSKLRIMTYDDVYENAKAVLENFLGSIEDVGGMTKIFPPNSR
jgi:hypothetical protein